LGGFYSDWQLALIGSNVLPQNTQSLKLNRLSPNTMNVPKIILSITTFTILSHYLSPDSLVAYANAFDPPPGQGAPKGTTGGGSRPVTPSCLIPPDSLAEPLLQRIALPTLLAPKTYLGLTSTSHPTFWVHIPNTTAKTIEFSLFDHHRNGIYQVSLPITQSAGMTSIPLPKTLPGLTIDRSYHWTIALVCNPKRRTEDWVSGGWIQRQQPNIRLQQDLNRSGKPMDRAKLYLQSNFWYDAMTILNQSQSSPSTEFNDLWSSAFDSAGIPKIEFP
jgi:Domain of Unknown Function (DUF928)